MGTLGAGRLKYFDLKLKRLHSNASLILQRFNDNGENRNEIKYGQIDEMRK